MRSLGVASSSCTCRYGESVHVAEIPSDVCHFTSHREGFATVLVERDEQIGRLTSFVSGVASGTVPETAAGTGRIAVINGPVASGKTALLHRTLELTAEAGPHVLTAVTSPAEQTMPFGVVEQLLRDAQAAADRLPLHSPAGPGAALGSEPRTESEPVPAEILTAFHSQLAGVCARGPVLIAVDDVQYADPQSLHCLAHALLRARSSGAMMSLMVTRGPDAGGTPPRILEELLYQLRGLHIRLSPLSVGGVGRLLAARAPDAGTKKSAAHASRSASQAASVHAATGGNPLLVHALIEDRLSRQRLSAAGPAAKDHPRPPVAVDGRHSVTPRGTVDPLDAADGEDDIGAGTGIDIAMDMDLDIDGEEHVLGAGPASGEAEDAFDGPPHAGEQFLQSALICVHRTGSDGLRVAQGIALLGCAGSVSLLARLVEVEERTVEQVVTALEEAGVLEQSRFRHGSVQTAVVESLTDDAATRLRQRAALLLYEDGAAPLFVAAQLLSHEMRAPDEEWVPRVLTEAARAALAVQRVGFAVRCLRMAESCCRDEAERMLLRANLAKYIWRVKPSAWPQQLRSLLGAVRDGLLPPVDTARLVCDLLWNGWMDDAATAIRQVVDVLHQSPDALLATELRALRLALASTYPTVLEHMGDGPAPAHGGERPPAPEESLLTAASVLHGVLRGSEGVRDAAAEDFADSAERALTSTRLTEETHLGMRACLLALLYADRLGTATLWADRLLVEAADRRAPGWTAVLRAMRAHMSLRRGHLAEARRLAEQALEQLPPHGWGVGIGMPLSALIEARTAMGDHEAAAELVDRPVPEEMLMTRYGLHYLYARGRHQLATGRHHAALTDFTACGELMRRWNMDRSALVPWRVGVAEAWVALGSREQAERFAREQLAGDAGQRVRGHALRVLAAARPLRERPALLGEAVTLLQEDGDWYELARALTDLGQAYKQLGDPSQGKVHTRRAWRIAEGCGARELYRSLQPSQPSPPASQPRPAAPADVVRPQSAAVSSLTDAERRVAALAAHGYTNREIGAKLFITVSTVEQHLTRVYRKINITHRQDLPVSLDIDVAHTA
ncbi:LuxR C-terminal-related transcriptional regulator [Streptomyces sp. NPDC048257]|uniref:helix-turn-helix transcriptional regulator n=1 Tax=Streptomyces sp. NPDC048257 TaxID=3365526 RepID=UPI00371D5681